MGGGSGGEESRSQACRTDAPLSTKPHAHTQTRTLQSRKPIPDGMIDIGGGGMVVQV